jgi:hypothetical protein
MRTAHCGVTGVGGTLRSIIAAHRIMQAALDCVTAIGGADIAIVTIHRRIYARPVAGVTAIGGADIAIVTDCGMLPTILGAGSYGIAMRHMRRHGGGAHGNFAGIARIARRIVAQRDSRLRLGVHRVGEHAEAHHEDAQPHKNSCVAVIIMHSASSLLSRYPLSSSFAAEEPALC